MISGGTGDGDEFIQREGDVERPEDVDRAEEAAEEEGEEEVDDDDEEEEGPDAGAEWEFSGEEGECEGLPWTR